jgi:hypothetical protein
VDIRECSESRAIQINASSGVVRGLLNTTSYTGPVSICNIQINVPKGSFVKAYVYVSCEIGSKWSVFMDKKSQWFSTTTCFLTAKGADYTVTTYEEQAVPVRLHFSTDSTLLLQIYPDKFVGLFAAERPYVTPDQLQVGHFSWRGHFSVKFEATHVNLRQTLHNWTMGKLQYLATCGLMDNANYLPLSNVSYTVTLPDPDLCVMTSWPVFDVRCSRKDYVELQTVSSDKRVTVWSTCGTQFFPAAVYTSSFLLRCQTVASSGLFFLPQGLSNGLFLS